MPEHLTLRFYNCQLSKKPDISTSKSRVSVSALAGFVPLLGWDCIYLINLEQADNYAPPCCKQQGIRIGDLMNTWYIIAGAVMLFIVAVLVMSIPDILRYLKIRSM